MEGISYRIFIGNFLCRRIVQNICVMYVCICNAITEKMLDDEPFLINKVGTKCGKCLDNSSIIGHNITYLVEKDERDN